MLLFLSHASADGHIAQAIHDHVSRLGVEVYLAEHDNRAGEQLTGKVLANIQRSDLVVALLTPSGFSSDFVHQEIGAASLAKKLVIPVVDPVIASENLGMLTGVEHIVLDPNEPATGLAKLTDRVSDLARRHQSKQDIILLAVAVAGILALTYLATQE